MGAMASLWVKVRRLPLMGVVMGTERGGGPGRCLAGGAGGKPPASPFSIQIESASSTFPVAGCGHSGRMRTNVLNGPLQICCFAPTTGFYRDGFCRTGPEDRGLHTVCAVMTAEFLQFSRQQGNDLSTPVPEYDFPGLKPGDHWCLCVTRWAEALAAGHAPMVVLEATHISALEFVSLESLQAHAAT